MVDKPHMDPKTKPPVDGGVKSSESTTGTPHYKGGQIEAKPMTFLGMQFTGAEAQKLWNVIIQTVNSQISKDKDRAIKAIRKLRNAETGQDDDS
ncbi:MAG: hypothetical protein V4487_04485 [Chlamydiota bacterium]